MPAAVYAPNYPNDQQFLPSSGTVNKDATKKSGNKDFIGGTTVTAKYHPNAPGDQNFA